MLTYKFRLYPTPRQTKVLNDTLETCRRLYNDSLGELSSDWNVDFWEQKQLLTLRKPDNKYYKQVNAQVLQDVLLRLDKAYQTFFKKMSRYPRFKRKDRYNSFSYLQYGRDAEWLQKKSLTFLCVRLNITAAGRSWTETSMQLSTF